MWLLNDKRIKLGLGLKRIPPNDWLLLFLTFSILRTVRNYYCMHFMTIPNVQTATIAIIISISKHLPLLLLLPFLGTTICIRNIASLNNWERRRRRRRRRRRKIFRLRNERGWRSGSCPLTH